MIHDSIIQTTQTDDFHGRDTTIVVPNWNGLEELKCCLESIHRHAPEAALIIVDNGSDDGSRDYLRSREFRQAFPAARVFLLPKNTGFCHAVNLGVRKAATEYVFLLNNDAALLPGCIQALERGMKEKTEAFSLQALMYNKEGNKIDSAGDIYCALGYSWSLGRGKPAAAFPAWPKADRSSGKTSAGRKSFMKQALPIRLRRSSKI